MENNIDFYYPHCGNASVDALDINKSGKICESSDLETALMDVRGKGYQPGPYVQVSNADKNAGLILVKEKGRGTAIMISEESEKEKGKLIYCAYRLGEDFIKSELMLKPEEIEDREDRLTKPF